MTREQILEEIDAWTARHKVETAKLLEVFSHPAYPGNQGTFTPEVLALAHEAGVLPKAQLRDGVYYFGKCRNAYVARWDAHRQCFTYIRSKFGSRFPEDICVPEDDDGYDLFLAVMEVEPEDQEKIPVDWRG